jgi:hypothetical protein
MPAADTECFQIFMDILANKYPKDFILLFVDGARGSIMARDL